MTRGLSEEELIMAGFGKNDLGEWTRFFEEQGAKISDRYDPETGVINREVILPGTIEKIDINCSFQVDE